MLAQAAPSSANPNMIRLGYTSCASCHLSPQGSGLLNVYGQGVAGAQSLFAREYEKVEDERGPRVMFDVRALGLRNLTEGGTDSTSFTVLGLGSVRASDAHRFTYTVSLSTPGITVAGANAPVNATLPKFVWQYRVKPGLEVQAGRDALPTGIGLSDVQAFVRGATNAGAPASPSQVKAFWWTNRFEVTPYAFGPSGNETTSAAREWGGGVLAGVNLNKRAVIGISGLDGHGSTFDRRTLGAYARLGFGKWGVLAEHQVIDRSTTATTGTVAGHTEIFVAPREWLMATLVAGELQVYTPTSTTTVRLAPNVQVRVSENLLVSFTSRDTFTPAGRTRTYTFLMILKTYN